MAPEQAHAVQTTFHGKSNLAAMLLFAGLDRLLYGEQALRREGPVQLPIGKQQVSYKTLDMHGYHLPEEPPPPKPPPPPRNPPPPNPPRPPPE